MTLVPKFPWLAAPKAVHSPTIEATSLVSVTGYVCSPTCILQLQRLRDADYNSGSNHAKHELLGYCCNILSEKVQRRRTRTP